MFLYVIQGLQGNPWTLAIETGYPQGREVAGVGERTLDMIPIRLHHWVSSAVLRVRSGAIDLLWNLKCPQPPSLAEHGDEERINPSNYSKVSKLSIPIINL